MDTHVSGKIAAWNIKNGFDGPQAMAIAEAIVAQEPDVVFLSEASKKAGGKPARLLDFLKESIGPVREVDYDDWDRRKDTHSFMGIAREEYGTAEAVVVGTYDTRKGLRYRVGELSLLGYHAFDRSYHGTRVDHEYRRIEQAERTIFSLKDGPAIVAGDLNAMHSSDRTARLLRKVGRLSDSLPAGEPGEPQSKLARLGSLAQRLSGMAFGGSIYLYEQTGFVDADPTHKGTKSLFGPLLNVQLDHIFARDVTMTDFAVVPAKGLSDHDMITARFSAVTTAQE